MNMKQYEFLQDSGHGWIGVPQAELIELGVASQISNYSYLERAQGDSIVWLEEDVDMQLWLRARGVTSSSEYRRFADESIRYVYVENAHVRNLPPYHRKEEATLSLVLEGMEKWELI